MCTVNTNNSFFSYKLRMLTLKIRIPQIPPNTIFWVTLRILPLENYTCDLILGVTVNTITKMLYKLIFRGCKHSVSAMERHGMYDTYSWLLVNCSNGIIKCRNRVGGGTTYVLNESQNIVLAVSIYHTFIGKLKEKNSAHSHWFRERWKG